MQTEPLVPLSNSVDYALVRAICDLAITQSQSRKAFMHATANEYERLGQALDASRVGEERAALKERMAEVKRLLESYLPLAKVPA